MQSKETLVPPMLTILGLSFFFQRKWAGLSIGQEVEGKLPV